MVNRRVMGSLLMSQAANTWSPAAAIVVAEKVSDLAARDQGRDSVVCLSPKT
jgi:hypothetical protein